MQKVRSGSAFESRLLELEEQSEGRVPDVEPTHVDHIIPLCTESTLEGKQRLFHYTNLRLVKEADNRAKGTSIDYQIM